MTTDAASYAEERYRDLVRNIASDLRRMADRFEREAAPVENSVNAPRFAWRASQGIHSVMWGLAGLSLERLCMFASEADAALADAAPEEDLRGLLELLGDESIAPLKRIDTAAAWLRETYVPGGE